MLSSKQRAALRGIANTEEVILWVGKGGIGEALLTQANDALTKRELIKGAVLENAPIDAKEAAATIAQAVDADVVQVIGRRFILFRRNKKHPVVSF